MAADLAHYIRDLSIILSTAAVTSLVSQWMRQPPVLGYLLAGMLLGPHVPGIVIGSEGEGGTEALTHALSELGVILLMFTIGIEFSLRKIVKIGPSAGLTAVFEVGLMISLGYLVGRMFGWGAVESLFVGACLGISSTMLVAKAFEEQKVRGGFAELTFAVLVFEDLIAIILLAVLTAVASGTGLGPAEFAITIGKLFGFLVGMLAIGLLVVPRFVRKIVRLGRAETTLIAGVAVCFTMATVATAAGYSVALGAFLAGMLVSESGEGSKVEHLIMPLRDIFAAIFFISIGMQIDPHLVLENWLPVVVLTALVLCGKVIGVSVGSFLAGGGVKNSVRAGMSLAQIGEFSFIIATLGIKKGAIGAYVFPIAVAVSLLTSLTTPLMVRGSQRAAEAVERRMPAKLQTFVTFYEAWIEQLRSTPRAVSVWSRIRSAVVMIAVDAVLLLAVLAGSRMVHWEVVTTLSYRFTLPAELVEVSWIGLTLILAGIFLAGVLRRIGGLARTLAEVVLPRRESDEKANKPDLGLAPRRMFTVALQLALSLVIGLPLIAVSQPFVPPSAGLAVLVLVLVVLGYNAWRSVTNLQGHVMAGTELIVEMLRRESREAPDPHKASESRVAAQTLLPGLPGMTAIRLDETSAAVGHTLARVNLRIRTGATVLTLNREGHGVVTPQPREKLQVGDVLTLTGTEEAVDQARAILLKGPVVDPTFAEYMRKATAD
jgi:CPA2 family monovalent cation:H+ antiporter-2